MVITKRKRTLAVMKYMSIKELLFTRKDRQVSYYDTSRQFAAEQFAREFSQLLGEIRLEKNKQGLLFLCIGSDRSTGDSLGPLIGYKLKERRIPDIAVLGTLDEPVHAINLEDHMEMIRRGYQEHIVVAVDASVGSRDNVGFITLGKGSLKPGLGVSKDLSEVGDLFITGIVSGQGTCDPLLLQSTRLSMVMRLADCISDGICLSHWERKKAE